MANQPTEAQKGQTGTQKGQQTPGQNVHQPRPEDETNPGQKAQVRKDPEEAKQEEAKRRDREQSPSREKPHGQGDRR